MLGQQFCPSGQYRPSIDVLNAAQSGARSDNLMHELDYLLKQLDDAYGKAIIAPSDWKLLTLFIGSNDICHSCTSPSSRPEAYAMNVRDAIERIRLNIRNVYIQIGKSITWLYLLTDNNNMPFRIGQVGVMRVEQIFVQTKAYPKYCEPFPRSTFVLHNYECECAHTQANRTIMANFTPQYNLQLQQIVQSYAPNDTFAVVYQPLNINITSFPIDAIRFVAF